MAPETQNKPERISKRIARSGICSRRDAEKLIEEGRVMVDGKKITSPALNVTNEKIEIDNVVIPTKEVPRIFLYYKPVGLVTSHKDEKDRPTVFDNLPDDLPRVVSVGRLDLNSEGLLILTNDGELARQFELPSSGYQRKYRVRVFGHVQISELKKLKAGVTIEGVRYGKVIVEIEKLGPNSWLTVILEEGKNREIRKIMNYLGLQVSRLIRTEYGDYKLGGLQPGQVREVELP